MGPVKKALGESEVGRRGLYKREKEKQESRKAFTDALDMAGLKTFKRLYEDTVPNDYWEAVEYGKDENGNQLWVDRDGNLYTDKNKADKANRALTEKWEATTEEGMAHREARLRGELEKDLFQIGTKYDIGAAAEQAWADADNEYEKEYQAWKKNREEEDKNPFIVWGRANGGMATRAQEATDIEAMRLKSHDIERMTDKAWNNIGKTKQKAIIDDYSRALRAYYPDASEEELQKAAGELARQRVGQAMYDYAVEKNKPTSGWEYFLKNTAEGTSLGKIMSADARRKAGTVGDMGAHQVAMDTYGKNHAVARIASDVTGIAVDPMTSAAGGFGSMAVKGSVWLGTKLLGGAFMRRFAGSLAGRALGGAIGGSANLGAFMGAGEALEQMKWGGKATYNPETNQYEVGDYDPDAIKSAAKRGMLLGSATGVVSPLIGNVSSKAVAATGSTAGKVGIRMGEVIGGTMAEGTIFAIPEFYNTYVEYADLISSVSTPGSPNYIESETDREEAIAKLLEQRNEAMMDVWTDNIATMAGFKANHVMKSAPRVLFELSGKRGTKAGFNTRLRAILDGRSDMAMTKDEEAELEKGGYKDLLDMNKRAANYLERKAQEKNPMPEDDEPIPFDRVTDLVKDNSISEAARAKMYYYVTGRTLPMHTVLGVQVDEVKDEAGKVTGYTVQSIGANGVVTSRTFDTKRRADVEVAKISRQVELNRIDMGEKGMDQIGDYQRIMEACADVSAEMDIPIMELYNVMRRDPNTYTAADQVKADAVRYAYQQKGDKYSSGDLRRQINEAYGVDVDKAIAKEPGSRSEAERDAVAEYERRLNEDSDRRRRLYKEGYDAEDSDEMQAIRIRMEEKRMKLLEIATDDMLDMLDEDPVSALAFIGAQKTWTKEERQMASEYVDAKTAYDGMIQRAKDRMTEGAATVEEQAMARVHSEEKGGDGMIHPLKLVDGSNVELIDGRLVLDDEGNVDHGETQGALIVRNPETGERKYIYADEIASVEAPINPQELIGTSVAASNEKIAEEVGGKIDGVLKFLPGDTYTVMDDYGRVLQVEMKKDHGNNNVTVVADGREMPIAKAQLQQWADNYARSRVREQQAATEKKEETPREQQAPQQTETQPQRPEERKPEPMPMIGEGEDASPDFAAVTPQRAAQWLDTESELPKEAADKFVANKIAKAQKALDAAKDVAVPEMEDDIPKYKKAVAARQRDIDNAQKELDYWNGVKAAREESRRASEVKPEVRETPSAVEEPKVDAEQKPAEEKGQEQVPEKEPSEEKPAEREKSTGNKFLDAYENEQGTVSRKGGLRKNELADSLPEYWRGTLHAMGRRIGRTIEIISAAEAKERFGYEEARGWYLDGTKSIYLVAEKTDSDSLRAFVAGHEITHALKEENPELWNQFVEAVKDVMGEDFEAEWQRTREVYDKEYDRQREKRGNGEFERLSDDSVTDEVCSNWAGRHMLADEEAVREMLEHAESVGADTKAIIEKVMNWLTERLAQLKEWLGIGEDMRDEIVKMTRAKELWKAMYDVATARENERKKAVDDISKKGGQVDEAKGDVKFAVADMLEGDEYETAVKELMAVTGRSERTCRRYLDAEKSLAKVILEEDNVALLDLQVDESVPSIWNNSDYPQGTVEFSNICRKRLPFTLIYQRLQKEFPNMVIDAKTLEDIRGIMKKEGSDVACGLCFVEDRRQLLGEIGQSFIDMLKGKDVDPNANQVKAHEKLIKSGDKYVPNLYELLTLDGMKGLRKAHPAVAQAFIEYNSARGMQAGRLFQAYSAYHRDILNYNKARVKSINDNGGLRIFSFSDFEAHHLIDLVQVLTDCSIKGIKVQGYTKVPEFAKAVKDTGMKLNRSLIPKIKGVVDADYVPKEDEAVSPNVINGKRLLFDTVEGINVNHPDFFDSTDNKNVGNIVVGINDEQIMLAMLDPFVDYIIPFHSGLSEKIRAQKGIGEWVNYKLTQLEKKYNAEGKLVNADKHGVNIYTDVLPRGKDLIGHDIKNAKDFQRAFFKVCEEKGWVPRFSKFINTNKKGEYVYTPGYEKLLIDFKLFDKNGKLIPQEVVKPIFDNEYNKQILNDYVKDVKENGSGVTDELYEKVKEGLGLNESSEAQQGVRFSFSKSPEEFDQIREKAKKDNGTVMSGLASKNVEIIDIGRHPFTGSFGNAVEQAIKWARENLIKKKDEEPFRFEDGTPFEITGGSIKEFLHGSNIDLSENGGLHLATMMKLPEILRKSIEVEVHPDYLHNEEGHRTLDSEINPNVLVHWFYGAVRLDGEDLIRHVAFQVHEKRDSNKKLWTYKVNRIELDDAPAESSENTSRPALAMTSVNSITGAKLLKGVKKSKDSDKFILEESAKLDEANNNREKSDNISQGHDSAATSIKQTPGGMKKVDWVSGTVNVDIGGGRFDDATDWLRERGVENLVFDPFNRDAEHNRKVAERVRDEKADTATCHNVLNVIDTESSRANVILQAAKAIKPDGVAYFTTYEGDKSGIGKDKGHGRWQNNRRTKDYVSEIERYFDDVQVRNKVIYARKPKVTTEQSLWDFDGTFSGNGIRFSLAPEFQKRSREEMDSGKVPFNGKVIKDGEESKFEVIDDGKKKFNNWYGTMINRYQDNVGKLMGGVYVHKDYATDIVPEDIYAKAAEVAEKEGFKYNSVYYDKKTPNIVRFDEAPDFDTAREPIPGNWIKVDVNTGKVVKTGKSNQIWHHKWMWVKDDYKGFDVDEAYNWSKQWSQKISNPDGWAYKWDYLLDQAGLPKDWEGSALSSDGSKVSDSVSLNFGTDIDLNDDHVTLPRVKNFVQSIKVPQRITSMSQAAGWTFQMLGRIRGALNRLYGEKGSKDFTTGILSADSTNGRKIDIENAKESRERVNQYLDFVEPKLYEARDNSTSDEAREYFENKIDDCNYARQWYDRAAEGDTSVVDDSAPRFSIGTEELFDRAKKHFGVTNDLREAGYILPDGTMLDFSGRHMLDKGQDSRHLSGQRHVDHREVQSLAYEADGDTPTGIETSMQDFIGRGAIRIDDNAGSINLSQKPTPKQAQVLRRLIQRNNGYVMVEIGNGWDTEHYGEYDDGTKASKVLGDIDRYFDEGIKFSIGNTFYSNAERAVEGIKQDKATAEQWLSMVQKAGGLKAGEDKWLGLSDWLNERKGQKVTKAEVLDFIRENQVQVEEVEYGELSSDDLAKAIDDMRGLEFRDDFFDAFEVDEGFAAINDSEKAAELYERETGEEVELDEDGFMTPDQEADVVRWAEDIAERAMDQYSGAGAINETRLNYTTDGLDDKKEIALTVPTIESWNENDEIHFGDAGEGRAVAWVRFGDAEDMDGNRVLVIDEIQSKRHQEGRERGYKGNDSPVEKRHRATAAMNEYRRKMQEKYGEYFLTDDMTPEEQKEYDRLYNEMQSTMEADNDKNKSYDVPAAPFEKNWHEVAMKRMLRYAAENGYDKVAWTKGAQQAERYNLSTKISKIEKERKNRNETTIDITIRDTNGLMSFDVDNDGIITHAYQSKYSDTEGKPLSDVLGKELAKEVLTSRKRKFELDEGTVIGGEGMSGFYDQMLPRFMDKYGKKWGVKTSEVELPGLSEKGSREELSDGSKGLKMWGVDVTPEMKESVMQGQPLFSIGLPVEEIESRIGEKLDDSNYNKSIRKINPFIGLLWSDKIPRWLDYRDVFKTPSTEDYYIDTKANFESVGATPADRTPEAMEEVERENKRTWQQMKESGKYEHHESPQSDSEYLVDTSNGDIYRYSDHWGRVSSCQWNIDDAQRGIFQIGKCNIADFKRWGGHHKVKNEDYSKAYADALSKTIDNYTKLLDSNVEISDGARRKIEQVLSQYRQLLNLFNEQGEVQENGRGIRFSIGDQEEIEANDEELYPEGEGTPEAEAGINVDSVDTSYGAGELSHADMALDFLAKQAAKNAADVTQRMDAMHAIGGNLNRLRRAMALQREYDRGTVKDIVSMAKIFINSGLFNTMSDKKVKRLLGIVQGVTGQNDVSRYAERLVDLMTEMQLAECDNILRKLLRPGKKVDAKGVEVQGTLDVDGQRLVQTVRQGMKMGKDALNQAMANALNDLDSENEVIAKNAAIDYQAYKLAIEWLDDVRESMDQERLLRTDMRDTKERMKAEVDAATDPEEKKRIRESYKQMLEETRKTIREMRMERVDGYFRLITSLGGDIKDSVRRAKEFAEQEKQRISEIHHNANSDLEGIPALSQVKTKEVHPYARNANNSLLRIANSTLQSFEKWMRFFGRKAHNGEGYLFNRFMRGWVDCNHNEWVNYRRSIKEMDDKVGKVMGEKMRWEDLYDIDRLWDGVTIEYQDNGETVTRELTQGQALYLYMVNKMSDGRMKLRAMGITEEDIARLREHIDNRFIQLADWMQSEFLVKKREEYNKVHERLFGASMANIEDYFPLVLSKADIEKPKDVTDANDPLLASTVTGAVIKRTKNSKPIDINTNAFDVLAKHIKDMEHWAAWGEWNRDLNTLRNYKRFRNRLRNMSSLEFGQGGELLKAFDKVCRVATGVYGKGDEHGEVDKWAVNVGKLVTAAKIAFRPFTALKQLLSLPAFWNGDARVRDLAKASLNLINWEKTENTMLWAMENVPGFSKRWESRMSGDARLVDTDSDFAYLHDKWVKGMSRTGMLPNASVDIVACAIGARAVYLTKKNTYLKRGYTEEQAEQKALQDASISINGSQQSSELAFVSTVQKDRTLKSVVMTVFRTASIGYTRRVTTALRNIKYHMQPGYKEQSIEFMAKQMVRDGLTEQQAQAAAERIYGRSVWRSMSDVFTFGFVLPFWWNLGPYMAYLLWGDDDDEKEAMIKDSATHALFGPIEGMFGGDVASDFGNALVSGDDIKNHNLKEWPLYSDFNKLKNKWDTNKWAAANDLFNLLVQSGLGVNPQTFTDAFVAGMDFFGKDPEISFEYGLLIMRILQVPQSALDKVYLDELGMSAADAKKLSADQLAARYARYKGMKEAPFTWWLYDDELRGKVLDKYEKRFNKDMKAMMENMDANELAREYDWAAGHGDEMRRKAIESGIDNEAKALKGDDIKKYYDKWKDAPDNSAYNQYLKKKTKSKYETYLDENAGSWDDATYEKEFNAETDKAFRTKIGNKYAVSHGSTSQRNIDNGEAYDAYYNEIKDFADLAEDVMLAAAKKEAEEMGDKARASAIGKAQKHLTSWRKDLLWEDGSRVDADEAKAVLEDVRQLRREYLKELGIIP